MLPQIYSNIHCLPSTSVVEHYSKSSKISTRWYKCNRKYTQDLMSHIPKTFQAVYVYYKKIEEASRWIFYSYLICLSNHPYICGFFNIASTDYSDLISIG